jgi:hypothetical protein
MVADDLSDYLTSQGHGANTTDTGTAPISIFSNFSPTTPDQVVMVYETGGLSTVHAMASGPGQAVQERPAVQIRCRAQTQTSARTLADDVFNSLDGFRTRTINGTRYNYMEAIQSPFILDRDDEEREVFAFNVRIMKDLG